MFEDEIEKERNAFKKLPIYLKCREISDVVNRIGELIPEDNLHLQEIKGWMMVDAAQLHIKVVGAETGSLYDLKMEAAAIIRKSAHDLILNQHSLEILGFSEVNIITL